MALSIIAVLPFILSLSYAIAVFVPSGFGFLGFASEVSHTLDKSDQPVFQGDPGDWTEQFQMRRADVQRRMQLQKESRHRQEEFGRWFRDPVMIGIAVFLTAVLGFLLWAFASSPAARLLSMWSARLARNEDGEAKSLLENLATGAGLPVPRLYVIEEAAPNAFAAPSGNHAGIAVTSGLLRLLDPRELEAVLAHELSHIANGDTRVNTVAGAIALFLRLPYLLRKRHQDVRAGEHNLTGFFPVHPVCYMALIPIWLYLYVIAPAVAMLLKAAISRNREYLADADAVLLTSYPEGLIRALAKIRGAGSALPSSNPAFAHFYFADPSPPGSATGFFSGNLSATHPPISDRVQRLVETHSDIPATVIEEAYLAGKNFAKPLEGVARVQTGMQDELSLLTTGNAMGRVFRVVGTTGAAPVYDRPNPTSRVLARVEPGQLVVAFDDPGPFRQVNTCRSQTFGYMPRSVKLKAVDMLPEDAYNAVTRAAAEAPRKAAEGVPTAEPGGLTTKQIVLLTVIAAIVFGVAWIAIRP